jgi:SAM-dependent methyltransferase
LASTPPPPWPQRRRLTSPTTLTRESALADAQHLPFADGVFDGCRAERVLQHLPNPARAVAEMARVTRPRGLVLVGDTDWGGWLLDAPDDQATQAVMQAAAGRSRHPWIGRQLVGLFHRAGLGDLQVEIVTYPVSDFDGPPALPLITVTGRTST